MKNAALKKTPASLKKPSSTKKASLKVSDKKENICTHTGCKKEANNQGYCRLHYITNWKHIRFKEKVKAERRLNAYVDKISKNNPKDYLERIKETLEDESKFKEMVSELEIELDMSPKETDDEFLAKFLRAVKPGSSE